MSSSRAKTDLDAMLSEAAEKPKPPPSFKVGMNIDKFSKSIEDKKKTKEDKGTIVPPVNYLSDE